MNILEKLKEYFKKINLEFNCETCPDDSTYRVRLYFDDSKFSVVNKDNQEDNSNKIYFILESPHKAEFEKGRAIGPAQGETGKRFNECLINVLSLLQFRDSCFPKGFYDISIINAIQYQASLGLNPENYRTVTFQLLWNEFGKKDFIERLKQITKSTNSCYIINACTKGNKLSISKAKDLIEKTKYKGNIELDKSKIDLSNLVKDAILESKDSFEYFETTHPSRWNILIKKE